MKENVTSTAIQTNQNNNGYLSEKTEIFDLSLEFVRKYILFQVNNKNNQMPRAKLGREISRKIAWAMREMEEEATFPDRLDIDLTDQNSLRYIMYGTPTLYIIKKGQNESASMAKDEDWIKYGILVVNKLLETRIDQRTNNTYAKIDGFDISNINNALCYQNPISPNGSKPT